MLMGTAASLVFLVPTSTGITTHCEETNEQNNKKGSGWSKLAFWKSSNAEHTATNNNNEDNNNISSSLMGRLLQKDADGNTDWSASANQITKPEFWDTVATISGEKVRTITLTSPAQPHQKWNIFLFTEHCCYLKKNHMTFEKCHIVLSHTKTIIAPTNTHHLKILPHAVTLPAVANSSRYRYSYAIIVRICFGILFGICTSRSRTWSCGSVRIGLYELTNLTVLWLRSGRSYQISTRF